MIRATTLIMIVAVESDRMMARCMKNWFGSLLNRAIPGAAADGSWTPGTVMSVVAHPDDDLYFLNPGISVAISASVPVVGIVITAAEGDGRNVDTSDPNRGEIPVDYAGYATARRVGLRRAYAKMAGLATDGAWRRDLVRLRSGLLAERDHLEERPDVVLYFFNIGHRDGGTLLPSLMDGTVDDARHCHRPTCGQMRSR